MDKVRVEHNFLLRVVLNQCVGRSSGVTRRIKIFFQ
jgi:hypothetical protein